MSKPTDLKSQANIVSALKQVDDDPQSFETLMATWNEIFELSQRSGERTFADVEQAAIASGISNDHENALTTVGRQAGQLLEQFETPAFLVSEDGRIITQNSSALNMYRVGPNDMLDDLPFDLEQDEPIADVVRATLNPKRNRHEAVLKRAYSSTDDSIVTLSIAPSKPLSEGKGEALVFVVDARWKIAAAGLITQEFDLTQAERELLVGFLDGKSTQDMAIARNRSHATVRTQFHSLMSKMGARSQTELFRNALSISQFVDKISEIAKILRHPHRKRVDIVRPGGRSVEVIMSGDHSGKPMVYFPCIFSYTFAPRVEQLFYDAGICVLAVCRPGHGDTDPAVEGKTYFETAADDICAILDQLGHKSCLFFATTVVASVMYHVAPHMAGRVAGFAQVSANLPSHYMSDADVNVPWVKGLFRASRKHPALMEFFLKAGLRAYRAMGQTRFVTLQFKDYPKDLAFLTSPEVREKSQFALDVCTKQGYDAAAFDIALSMEDYRSQIDMTNKPILVLHGEKNQFCSVHAVRRFVQDYKDRVTYVEAEDGTVTHFDLRPKENIDHIAAFYTQITDGNKTNGSTNTQK